MKEAGKNASIVFLMSIGMALSLLACLDLTACGWLAAAVCGGSAIINMVFELPGLPKWVRRVIFYCLLAVLAVVAAPRMMGPSAVAMHAVWMHLQGVNGALPMVAQDVALVISVMAVLTGMGVTCARSGVAAIALTAVLALVLWLADAPQALPWLAPTVVAALLQTALSDHESLSLRRVLPLAAVVTALAFLITPADGVTVQPMKDAADKLREQIFARFMFTQPRNVFSLADEGYYPQGPGQLGGTAEPTDHPVMLVKTPRNTYLRGAVKDQYTGRVWVDTLAGRRYLWSGLQWQDARTATFNMLLPEGALGEDSGLMAHQTVSVQMLTSSASSLFVPQRIRQLNPGGELVPYFNSSSEVFVTRDLAQGDTYTVTAPLMMAGDAGLGTLIQACAANGDDQYQQILRDYTVLPDHLQEQVYKIAQEASEGAQTPYDKAYAIQTYLARNFRYTLEVEPQPENIDFVSNFLVNTKEGYCTYFASAMTVLCRMEGLPARYVEGYLAQPDAEGHAYVTGLDGHAWTEVYFEGFGWLTFDATPGQSRISQPPEDLLPPESQEPDPTPTPEPEDTPPEATPTPEPQADPKDPATPTPPPDALNQEPPRQDPPDLRWMWWLLLPLILALLALRIWWTQPARCAARAKDEMGRWSAWMQALSDGLNVLKLQRAPSESPMAYMCRVDGLHRFPADMSPIGECAALIFYGRVAPEPEETAMVRDAYGRVASTMRWWQRTKVALVRAFTPEKKRTFTK